MQMGVGKGFGAAVGREAIPAQDIGFFCVGADGEGSSGGVAGDPATSFDNVGDDEATD